MVSYNADNVRQGDWDQTKEETIAEALQGEVSKSELHQLRDDKLGTQTIQDAATSAVSDNPPAVDSSPPISLARFAEESGFSPATIWRYRRAGWLRTVNIAGRQYITRAEILRFNKRAAAGEFARVPSCSRLTKTNRN